MPPIAITFHTRPPPLPHGRLPVTHKTSHSGTRGKTKHRDPYLYFSIDTSVPATAAHHPTLPEDPSTIFGNGPTTTTSGASPAPPAPSSANTTPSPTSIPSSLHAQKSGTKSKRGKPAFVHPAPTAASGKVFTLTPLIEPIVDRCVHVTTAKVSSSSTPNITSPPSSKRSASVLAMKKKVTSAPVCHPYSRTVDMRNDRSNVPSPREILRAERAELERLRAREESVAAARAAAALKRRKGTKSRGGSKATSLACSVSPKQKDREKLSDEEKETNSEDKEEKETTVPPPAHSSLPPRVGLKRTRSTGLGISTAVAGVYGAAGPAVSSPLRSVTVAGGHEDEDEDGHHRKRSRLGQADDDGTRRRATTGSPTDRTSRLPAIGPKDDVPKTEPIPQTETLSQNTLLPEHNSAVADDEVDMDSAPSGATRRRASAGAGTFDKGETMRRVASAGGGPLGAKHLAKGLPNSLLESMNHRSRREVTVPARLRDYEVKAAV